MQLKDLNYVYTKGSGPGDIETEYISNNQENIYTGGSRFNYNEKTPTDSKAFGCLILIVLFILFSMCSKH
jgi:hypothetical protein